MIGWSYLLAAVGILGLILAGRRKAIGWAIGLAAQALWIAYALATHQYGFIVSALAYAAVYGRNWLAWSREAELETVSVYGQPFTLDDNPAPPATPSRRYNPNRIEGGGQVLASKHLKPRIQDSPPPPPGAGPRKPPNPGRPERWIP